MTPLARWLTNRSGILGGGILVVQRVMAEHVARHEAQRAKVRRLLDLLDAAQEELGTLVEMSPRSVGVPSPSARGPRALLGERRKTG